MSKQLLTKRDKDHNYISIETTRFCKIKEKIISTNESIVHECIAAKIIKIMIFVINIQSVTGYRGSDYKITELCNSA